jgi:hypothetical protein
MLLCDLWQPPPHLLLLLPYYEHTQSGVHAVTILPPCQASGGSVDGDKWWLESFPLLEMIWPWISTNLPNVFFLDQPISMDQRHAPNTAAVQYDDTQLVQQIEPSVTSKDIQRLEDDIGPTTFQCVLFVGTFLRFRQMVLRATRLTIRMSYVI